MRWRNAALKTSWQACSWSNVFYKKNTTNLSHGTLFQNEVTVTRSVVRVLGMHTYFCNMCFPFSFLSGSVQQEILKVLTRSLMESVVHIDETLPHSKWNLGMNKFHPNKASTEYWFNIGASGCLFNCSVDSLCPMIPWSSLTWPALLRSLPSKDWLSYSCKRSVDPMFELK